MAHFLSTRGFLSERGSEELVRAGFLSHFPIDCPKTPFEQLLFDDINEVFLNDSEFAVIGMYTDKFSKTYEIKGIFNDPHVESDPDTTIGVTSQKPSFRCELSEITKRSGSVNRGDQIEVCPNIYEVVDTQPNGVGMTTLILHESVA